MAKAQATLLAVAIIVAALTFRTASGASYTVGEPGGSWDQKTDLKSWASSIDFKAGDELVFKYSAAAHDVVEVTRSGYRSCSAASPVATFRTGNDAVQLGGVGVRYFICGVPGHCAAGMKMKVRVWPAGCDRPPVVNNGTAVSNGNGTDGGVCLGNNSPPTVITAPGFTSHGAAPGSSGSVNFALVVMVLLMMLGIVL